MSDEYKEETSSRSADSGSSAVDPNHKNRKGAERPAMFNRLFVLGDKRSSEENYTDAFSKYGTVRDVKMMYDKNSREPNGIAYITMSKTSEAALCVEKITGQVLSGAVRAMKVLFASDRMTDKKTQSDAEINEQVCRLFLFVSRTLNENELREQFSKYGAITNLTILQDKVTRESKGLAFITYSKASAAAQAYEECDESYRPKFADPFSRKRGRDDDDRPREQYNHDRDSRDPRDGDRHTMKDRDYNYRERERDYGYLDRERDLTFRGRERERDRYSSGEQTRLATAPGSALGSQKSAAGVMDYLSTYPNNGVTTLLAKVPKGLTNGQITKLFNLVPTLDNCALVSNSYSVKDEARVTYSSPACAAYALEVFSGFEYPPGCALEVEFVQQPMPGDGGLFNAAARGSEPGYEKARASASGLYDSAFVPPNTSPSRLGYTDFASSNNRGDNSWMHALPPPQPLVDHAGDCLKRLFFVCSPSRIDFGTLENLFSRFGFLIHINYLPGKACGFAKFANLACATVALETLNERNVDGITLKVMEAQAPPEKVVRQE